VPQQLTLEVSAPVTGNHVRSPNPKPRVRSRQSAVQAVNTPKSPSSIVGEFPPHIQSLSLSDRNLTSNFGKSNLSSLVQPLTNSTEFLHRQQLSQSPPPLEQNDLPDCYNQICPDHSEDPPLDPVIQQIKARLRKN
jgi:hypothetical protein